MRTDLPLFPDSASTIAPQVDGIFFFGLAIAVVFSLLIAVLIIFFAVRYKRRSISEVGQPQPSPAWLEITWSVIPLGIMLIMFGWGAKVYFNTYNVPDDAERYYVVGKRWMWKFQHPEGNREINDFHVPVGRRIELLITSEDVIHSFFVPAFRVKRDAVPGRYTKAWFEATKTGSFNIFCAEYCGAEHSLMRGKLVVMEQADYDRWLSGSRPEQSLAATGEALFEAKACITCHRMDTSARAPYLAGLYGKSVVMADGSSIVVDDNYVRESITNPAAKVVAGYQPIMPTYRGQLTEEEILELMSYIKSLEGADVTEAGR